jgi:ubiquinone/menaquinone biosynthesis C-methylase UbiE
MEVTVRSPPPEVARVTRSKKAAKANYDRLSSWYDAFSAMGERALIRQGLAVLSPKEGEHILELGFGTGWALLQIARAVGDSGKVSGIDLSEGMLQRATSRAERAGLSAIIDLMSGDAADLPYRDGQFDAIFTSFFLELMDTPEIPVVLEACKRVLKPGGRLAIVSMAHVAQQNVALRAYMWAHARFPVLVDCRPIRVRESLEEAGFSITEAQRKGMWGLPVDIVLARTSGYFQ